MMFTLSYGASKVTGKFGARVVPSMVLPVITYMIAIASQILFIYAMPAVIIERKGFFPAIKKGLLFFKKYFFPTVMLVLVPALIYIPVILINMKTDALVGRFFPEIIIGVIGSGIVATLIMDIFITTSPALIFLKKREVAI
jgi:hypothetical protein